MNVLAFLNFAAALQGIFLTYLLAHSRHKNRESMALGGLTLVLSISLLGAVLGLSGYYKILPHFIRIGDPFVLLYGPLVYLYIFTLIHQRLPKWYLLHGIPFLVYLMSNFPFYILPASEKIEFVNNVFLNNSLPRKVIFIQVLRLIHISVYVLLGCFQIRNYQRKIKAYFTDIEKISLNKASSIVRLFFAGTILSIIIYITGFLCSVNFVLTNNIIGLFISIIIYALAYSTWNKPGIKGISPVIDSEENLIGSSKKKEIVEKGKARSNYFLTDEQYLKYSQMLEKLLVEDKLFLDNDLNLSTLSTRMELQPYLVSELINRYAKETFFDYINRCRIEEIKKRLTNKQYDSFSILGIAFDCGFNSKSSFNTSFKKFTGSTPSVFRQKNIV